MYAGGQTPLTDRQVRNVRDIEPIPETSEPIPETSAAPTLTRGCAWENLEVLEQPGWFRLKECLIHPAGEENSCDTLFNLDPAPPPPLWDSIQKGAAYNAILSNLDSGQKRIRYQKKLYRIIQGEMVVSVKGSKICRTTKKAFCKKLAEVSCPYSRVFVAKLTI